MVRLGAFDLRVDTFKVKCFNSSMVRLGVTRVYGFGGSTNMFQFQYGAIGRMIAGPFQYGK